MLAHICFHVKRFLLLLLVRAKQHAYTCVVYRSVYFVIPKAQRKTVFYCITSESIFKIRIHREKKDTSHTAQTYMSTPISESPLQRQSMITVSRFLCCCWLVCLSVIRKIVFKYLRLHINGKKFCWFNPRQQFRCVTPKKMREGEKEEEMKNAWLASTHVWIAWQINQPN